MSGLELFLIPLVYVGLIILLLFVPLERSALIEFGHPKE